MIGLIIEVDSNDIDKEIQTIIKCREKLHSFKDKIELEIARNCSKITSYGVAIPQSRPEFAQFKEIKFEDMYKLEPLHMKLDKFKKESKCPKLQNMPSKGDPIGNVNFKERTKPIFSKFKIDY